MKRIAKSAQGAFWVIVFYALAASSALAQAQPGSSSTSSGGSSGTSSGGSSGSGFSGGFQNPLAFDTIDQFLQALLHVIVQIGFPIVVIAIIWSGFLFVKAQGNSAELQRARSAITWTLVGALLVLGAFVLSQLIQTTVNEIIG